MARRRTSKRRLREASGRECGVAVHERAASGGERGMAAVKLMEVRAGAGPGF